MKKEIYGDWVRHCETHVELLRARALDYPDKRAYTFLANGEVEDAHLTFAELDTQARTIAALLQKNDAFGQRVLLLYQPGLEYLAAFFGCLYAGAIAVPAYPPRLNHSLERLEAIVSDARPILALSSQTLASAALQKQFALSSHLGNLHIEVTDTLPPALADQWRDPELHQDSLAFFQYTSGSTGKPKGVMVSYGNLLYNHRMMEAMGQTPDDIPIVSWLPLFHDMGLIGNALHTVYRGIPCVLMAPTAFLQKPVRWLQAISQYKTYASFAPNFAYDLCVQKVTPEQRATLDLSCWRYAINSAEPIHMETLERFSETFASCGFRRDAFRPSYGLAEATLCVTTNQPGAPTLVQTLQREALERNTIVPAAGKGKGTIPVVGCGEVGLEQKIVIVDPDTRVECAADQVGEIWVKGPSVAQGYWNRPDETREVFHAHLADTGEGPFLRTGDLGFLQDGELYVTGRCKDLIIIRGQNYYPQDIELTAQRHPALISNGGAAFTVSVAGSERVVLVQEVERQAMHQDLQSVLDAVRQSISEEHDLHMYAIVFIKPGALIRTSSGKIRRHSCRDALLNGTLSWVFADLPEPLARLIEEHRVASIPPAIQTVQLEQRQTGEIVVNKEHPGAEKRGPMQFSLLYFSSNEAEFAANKYTLLLEGAKFADQHDFTAIWVPERHFHPFGGLYPNPSLLAAALAMITQKIRLRAGSVVLPLHHPARVVEEWSTIDNLSSGRVDIAFATGWNANDFVLAPANYAQRKDILFAGIETVQKLWAGEAVSFPNGVGKDTAIKVHPLPKQARLQPWITCSGTPERFAEAGAIGANVLTGLLFQSMEELEGKISIYRESLAKHGYDPASGHVTLMMHTFVGEDIEEVRNKVREPFIAYLKSSVDLWRGGSEKLDKLSPQEQDQVLSYAFERYFHTHALFGTPQTCEKMVRRLSEIGVDEIASLIDFGIDVEGTMEGLNWLNSLRKRCQKEQPVPAHSSGPMSRSQPAAHGVNGGSPVSMREVKEPEATGLNGNGKHEVKKQGTLDLRGVTQAERESRIQAYLQQQVAQALERTNEDIARVSNIRSLGLDSLMVMNIINTCQSELHVTLDAGEFYQRDSFASLAEYIVSELDILALDADGPRVNGDMQAIVQNPERKLSFPLSYAQQRLWFLHQLQPETPAYNVPTAIKIEGRLDQKAFAWSLEKIVERHESLRTTFTVKDGMPVQVIHPPSRVPLPIVNLQQFGPQEREATMRWLMSQMAVLPFDMVHGPLLRSLLLRLNSTESVLLFTYHHIVMDGWSLGVFIRELQQLYTAAVAGKPAALEELSIQYADYAVWQRQWLQQSVPTNSLKEQGQTHFEKELAYWKKQLGGNLPIVKVPTDRPRPPMQTFQGMHLPISFPEQLMEKLKELSRREGVSLFMVLLASFQVLLARYTGQEDILVGTPIAGRNRRELEPLIGFFVNILVLRTDLSGNPAFSEVLQRVRETCLGAYSHQEVPFDKVVEMLQPPRDMSRHPLFQVMFVLEQDSWYLETDMADIQLRQMVTESRLSVFDFTWSITSKGKGEVEYNTDLFDASTISRLIEHWQVLLEGIVQDVTLPVTQLPLLTARERVQMLEDWNATDTGYQANQCFHELFERGVEQNPETIAIVYGSEHLTYERLNQEANRLARHLSSLGMGPGSLAGICLHRSCEMVIALLAIFKVGGAYVPLDPAYPSERLAFMLADSQLSLLITSAELEESLPPHLIRTVQMPLSMDTLQQYSSTNLTVPVHPSLPAYVIYTSGSTGLPKGAMVPHCGLLNLADFQKHFFMQRAGSRVLQFASLSFDASIWEMAMTLLTGATLCMTKKDELLPGPSFVQLLNERAITTATLPPSTAAMLPAEQLSGLQTVVVAGEDCPARLVTQWASGRRFFNAYGPTEASVCATIKQCTDGTRKPTIGRPIANVQVYVLDASMQPVPVGVSGELYIGGASLAYGYLNRPELTATRFVPHPFARQEGERLYKTGDQVRYRADGSIEFMERIDYQVKIRGYRIELGEIEATLLRHPSIRECVVLAKDTPFADKQLVAYVVPREKSTFASEDARAFLRQHVPEHMVPATFVPLDHMPLTPNGKVDRKLLPDVEVVRRQLEQTLTLPVNEVEQTIAEIWQECLHVAKVGRDENFFELGGHSLLVISVQEKLQAHFQRQFALIDLFEYPTVSALARYIEQSGQETSQDGEELKRKKENRVQDLKSNRQRQKEKRMRVKTSVD